MSKGSLWRKWDLHIHTPESHEQQYRLSSQDRSNLEPNVWEKFVVALEGESDVAAIGITDYFSLEGYKKIVEYRENGRLANFDLILPNIEFRLDRVLATREGESQPRLNYHVIFSNEIDVDKIQTEFLQSIDIETEGAEKRTLTRENIEEIGRNLKEHHEQFQPRSDYYVGCTSIYVSLNQMLEILEDKSSIFGGKYILALADDYWSQIDWDQSHLIRRTLLMKSHALFASNRKTREWALGRSEGYSSQKKFKGEFGRLFPSVHGSDAHSFDELFKPDLDRYCWIKADPTFEGLKQIIFEPEERVRIQRENPEPRKSLYTLDQVELRNTKINQEVSLTEQTIPLNWNLLAITGGKGSGKTALVDLIANLFENRTQSGGRDENSFVQRIQDEKPDLHVEIEFLGDDVPSFAKDLMDESFYESSEITYLPQGMINEISGRREAMDSIIQEIIFDNKRVLKGGFRRKFGQLKSELRLLAEVIDELNNDIYKVEQEVEPRVVADAERSKMLKEGELKDKRMNSTRSLME